MEISSRSYTGKLYSEQIKYPYCGRDSLAAGCDGTLSAPFGASLRLTMLAIGAIAPPKALLWSGKLINSTPYIFNVIRRNFVRTERNFGM